jgi:hypothetical protein
MPVYRQLRNLKFRQYKVAAIAAGATIALATTAATPSMAAAATLAPAAGASLAPAPGASLAPAATSAANCTMPLLSQPFATWNDSNEYAFAPGTASDAFAGAGWTLSKGASITTSGLADGSTGSVLNLPYGATAVSPPMCVQWNFPDVRMMMRDADGKPGVNVLASYPGSGTSSSSGYAATGLGASWNNSQLHQIHPANIDGWQLLVLTVQGTDAGGVTQVYNLAVDPRMH